MNTTIVEQLEALMATGTEAEVKQFVIDHFADFPAETQQELAVGLFEDAVANGLAAQDEIDAMKAEAVAVIDSIETEEANG